MTQEHEREGDNSGSAQKIRPNSILKMTKSWPPLVSDQGTTTESGQCPNRVCVHKCYDHDEPACVRSSLKGKAATKNMVHTCQCLK